MPSDTFCRSSAPLFAEPVYKYSKTLSHPCGWPVSQHASGFVRVSPSNRDIAGAAIPSDHESRRAQVFRLVGSREIGCELPQTKYQRAPRSAETHSPGREDSRHDIIDEGTVASHGIVSEYWERLMGFRRNPKLPGCQIRYLIKSVNSFLSPSATVFRGIHKDFTGLSHQRPQPSVSFVWRGPRVMTER
jgi:hypothetical protein